MTRWEDLNENFNDGEPKPRSAAKATGDPASAIAGNSNKVPGEPAFDQHDLNELRSAERHFAELEHLLGQRHIGNICQVTR